MSKLLAVVFCLTGLAATAYVAVVVCLAGGISQLANGLQAKPHDTHDIAWGIIRIFPCAESSAAILLFITFLGTGAIWHLGSPRYRRSRTRLRSEPLRRPPKLRR